MTERTSTPERTQAGIPPARTGPQGPVRGTHDHILPLLLILLGVLLLLASIGPSGAPFHSATNLGASYTETSAIYVRVVRSGWGTASVLGVQNGTASGVAVSILVDGTVTSSTTTDYNGEFWKLLVPVANTSSVQAAIGSSISYPVSVPAYQPQPVAPSGIIYAQGSQLFVNGTPIQLFGVDEETAFTYAMIAAGLCGWTNPSQYWGNNQLFPSGPGTKIPGVSSVDQFWQKFFQYFLHYNQVAGNPTNPKTNVIRITVVDDTFVPEGAYYAWKNNPAAFWQIFDSMLYWAGKAGLYVVPVLGHLAQRGTSTVETWYNTSTPQFVRHVALVQAILARYNSNTRIAMWDLWNEPEINNDVYWASVGGITAFRAWATTLISAVKPYSSNHLVTMGMGDWTLFPGLPTSFGWEWYFFFNDMPGLEVGSNHYYATAQDQYLITWMTAWHQALNIPEFQGEFGYGASGGNSLGYGYWPWFAQQAMASGWSLATMVYLDDGVGPYADYPYLGSLPPYPNGTGSGGGSGPVASFSVSPNPPTAGSAATFDGSLSSDTATIVSYAWTFGDGGSGSGAVVTHTYASSGTYTASLTVTDSNASINRTSKSIQVAPPSSPPPDTTPPAAVTDLHTGAIGTTFVTLRWTAPGNNGTTGQASQYDLRYSTAGALNNTNFGSGTRVTTAAPDPAGTAETATVASLQSSTTYWFALRTADAVPNWSNVSNDATGTTASASGAQVAPSVATLAATATGTTTATLAGNLSDLGSAAAVDVGFLYGTSPSLVGATNGSAGTQTAAGSFTLSLTGLVPGTTYYYQAWAAGDAFSRGSIQTLSTSALPPGSLPPAVLGVTYAPDTRQLDITFSQPMNRTSVQTSLVLSPFVAYRVVWVNASHVQLILESSPAAPQDYGLTVQPTARSTSGSAMGDPFTFHFTMTPSSVAGPSPMDAFTSMWLPWVSLALAACVVVILALYLRGRRKYRKLSQTTRVLARRIDELAAAKARSQSGTQVSPRLRPVPKQTPRRPTASSTGSRVGNP